MYMLPKIEEIFEQHVMDHITYQDSPTTYDIAYPYDVVKDMLTKAIEDTKSAMVEWMKDNVRMREDFDVPSTREPYTDIESYSVSNPNGPDSTISVDRDSITYALTAPELKVL